MAKASSKHSTNTTKRRPGMVSAKSDTMPPAMAPTKLPNARCGRRPAPHRHGRTPLPGPVWLPAAGGQSLPRHPLPPHGSAAGAARQQLSAIAGTGRARLDGVGLVGRDEARLTSAAPDLVAVIAASRERRDRQFFLAPTVEHR